MKRSNRRGSVAALALAVGTVAVVTALGMSSFALQSMARAGRDSRANIAHQAAQAGLDLTIARAYRDIRGTQGRFTQSERIITGDLRELAEGATAGASVMPTADPTQAWVTCTVNYRSMVRSVRMFIQSRNVGIWNNAIFAGTGAAGQSINGNVDIRGSVHILGEGEAYSDLNGNARWDAAETFTDRNGNRVWDPGEPYIDGNGDGVWNSAEPYNDSNRNGVYDPPLTQTDLNSSFSGNGYVGNNYAGMPVELESLVPAPPRVNGIETLGTEVRVKHGRIGIDGSASVGTDDIVDGGTSKATVDGSFVSDGYTGNQGTRSVFSDNGTGNAYDVGNLGIKFPLISGIGAESYTDSDGASWPTQENFLDNRSLAVNVNSITPSTLAFAYGPDGRGNLIAFVPEVRQGNRITRPATLTINGIVKVNGNLTLGAGSSEIRYTGSGTLYASGDIGVRTNLLPLSGQLFPTQSRLGLIAKGNMNLATGNGDSQLKMAGAFYAQGTITSAKQNQIAGTFVGNYFDMGQNVPNIYQVPALPFNMPPGMPGDYVHYTLRTHSWRARTNR